MNNQNEETSKHQLCGCGAPARYSIGNMEDGTFVGACNKYLRCPSYEELQDEINTYRKEVYNISERLNNVNTNTDRDTMYWVINEAKELLRSIGVAKPAEKPQYGKKEDQ